MLERCTKSKARAFGAARASVCQHPLQMLFIFASTLESSARISISPGIEGPGVTVPSIRPPFPAPALVFAIPVVFDPAVPDVDPVEFAVPKVFVPGAVGTFTELPAPLGSLPELLRPPALAGPDGTPLTAAVPAPADPAFGDPTALPAPAEGLPAAPPVEDPPAEPPPEPPLPPPLPLCACAATGESNIATIMILTGNEPDMDLSLLELQRASSWSLPLSKASTHTVPWGST
jgi:hypothetical protein